MIQYDPGFLEFMTCGSAIRLKVSAYAVLSDPVKKRRYDEAGQLESDDEADYSDFDVFDLFETVFQGGPRAGGGLNSFIDAMIFGGMMGGEFDFSDGPDVDDMMQVFVEGFSEPIAGNKFRCKICVECGKSPSMCTFSTEDRISNHLETKHIDIFEMFLEKCEEADDEHPSDVFEACKGSLIDSAKAVRQRQVRRPTQSNARGRRRRR